MSKITIFDLPVKTVSEANCSEHFLKKWKRHKHQKWEVVKAFHDNNFEFNLPIEITLIRIASRMLDEGDNLPCSMKFIRDYLAAQIIPGKAAGRADDSKEITWKYDQKKCKVKENYVQVMIEEK